MSYEEQLRTLIRELENEPRIELQQSKLRRGARDFLVGELTSHFEAELSDEVLAFYESVNGLSVKWSCDIDAAGLERHPEDEGRRSIHGRIQINSLAGMLRGDERPVGPGWTDYLEEGELEDLEKFCVFDYNDDDIRIGFIAEDGSIGDELWYLLSESEGFGPLRCGLDLYLQALCESRGFQPWQHTFIFRDSPTQVETSRMIHYISQLFPDETFAQFLGAVE